MDRHVQILDTPRLVYRLIAETKLTKMVHTQPLNYGEKKTPSIFRREKKGGGVEGISCHSKFKKKNHTKKTTE